MEETGLTKVVLARRSDVSFKGRLDAFGLLQTLQVGPLFNTVSLPPDPELENASYCSGLKP